MKTSGRYIKSYRSDDDSMVICLEVENENIIKTLSKEKDKNYLIEFTKVESKRSQQANRYLWKLCDEIGLKLHLSKDIVYMMELSNFGVFVDVSVQKEAKNDTLLALKQQFKYIQEMANHGNYTDIRCYVGSSLYNKKEMQKLLEGVVQDAKDLGIDTWDHQEINMMINAWNN